MTRQVARETVMQMLYQMEAQADFSIEAKAAYLENFIEGDDNNQFDYINSVYEAYASHSDEIDDLIEASSKGWKLERLAKVDLAILRVCVAEMMYKSDSKVPVGVAINEAVSIAKKFGGDSSGKFVNGILGTVSKKM